MSMDAFPQDFHTVGYRSPLIDTRQNLEDTSASEVGGHTTLKFKRRLDTGDSKEDIVIKVSLKYILYIIYTLYHKWLSLFSLEQYDSSLFHAGFISFLEVMGVLVNKF